MAATSGFPYLPWWATAPLYREAGWTPVPRSPADSTTVSDLYFPVVLVLQLAVFVWETHVNWRQYRVLQNPQFPPRLARMLEAVDSKRKLRTKTESPEPQGEPLPVQSEEHDSLLTMMTEKAANTRAYELDKSTFAMVSGALRQVEATAALLLGFLPFASTLSGQILAHLELDPHHEIARALVMVTLTSLREGLVALPFSLYSTFVIEARHGFNKQTLGIFMTDALKISVLFITIKYALTAFLIYFVRRVGDAFFLYLPIVMSLVMTTLFGLAPFILVLFEKSHPLEQGSLRTKITQLAASLSFPMKNIVVAESSSRSGHSSAGIMGLGKTKTIFLDDTLLQQTTEDEILAVLCHEIGHSHLWHVPRGAASQLVVDFLKFYVFAKCLNDAALFAAFGFATPRETEAPLVIGYLLFSMAVWAPLGPLFKFINYQTSRKLEYEADAFAVDQGYGQSLQSGLTRLYAANLMAVQFDPLYSAYHNHHPTLLERLDAVEARERKRL